MYVHPCRRLGGPRQFPWRSVPWYHVQYDAWVSWEEPNPTSQPTDVRSGGRPGPPFWDLSTRAGDVRGLDAASLLHAFPAEQTTCTALLLLHVHVVSRVVS